MTLNPSYAPPPVSTLHGSICFRSVSTSITAFILSELMPAAFLHLLLLDAPRLASSSSESSTAFSNLLGLSRASAALARAGALAAFNCVGSQSSAGSHNGQSHRRQ